MIGVLALAAAACEPPKPSEAEASTVAESIIVEVGANGRILWNGEEVSLEELERRAKAAAGTPTELRFMTNDFAWGARIIEVLERTGLSKSAYVVGGAAE